MSCRDNVYYSARGHTPAAATARHAARAWRPRPARDIASRVSRSNWSVPHRPPGGVTCAADLHRPLHVRPITRSLPCAHCLYVLCTHTNVGRRCSRVALACVYLLIQLRCVAVCNVISNMRCALFVVSRIHLNYDDVMRGVSGGPPVRRLLIAIHIKLALFTAAERLRRFLVSNRTFKDPKNELSLIMF